MFLKMEKSVFLKKNKQIILHAKIKYLIIVKNRKQKKEEGKTSNGND